ncbi:MAG: hypothetical protein JNK56_23680 [Myxococcales bacterium]|nr:hypothetical protein [Myxococcales bacterium]
MDHAQEAASRAALAENLGVGVDAAVSEGLAATRGRRGPREVPDDLAERGLSMYIVDER